MTTENVIRAALEAYARGDLDGALSHCAEDMCFKTQAAPGNGGWEVDCHSLAEFRAALLDLSGEFEFEHYGLVEIIVSGERAATRQDVRARHRETGHPLNTQISGFWTVRDGKITNLQEFADTAMVVAAKRAVPAE